MAKLRQIEVTDAAMLYYHFSNPCVLRYSRLKPSSVEEMEKMITELLIEEAEKRVIPRVIVNEFDVVVGLITLWDYCPFRREGFLATLIGQDYWGMGYNQIAKDLFFDEVFNTQSLEHIYLLVRNYNERSIAACRKNPFLYQLNFIEEIELREFYQDMIKEDHIIFCVRKEDYINEEVSL